MNWKEIWFAIVCCGTILGIITTGLGAMINNAGLSILGALLYFISDRAIREGVEWMTCTCFLMNPSTPYTSNKSPETPEKKKRIEAEQTNKKIKSIKTFPVLFCLPIPLKECDWMPSSLQELEKKLKDIKEKQAIKKMQEEYAEQLENEYLNTQELNTLKKIKAKKVRIRWWYFQ